MSKINLQSSLNVSMNHDWIRKSTHGTTTIVRFSPFVCWLQKTINQSWSHSVLPSQNSAKEDVDEWSLTTTKFVCSYSIEGAVLQGQKSTPQAFLQRQYFTEQKEGGLAPLCIRAQLAQHLTQKIVGRSSSSSYWSLILSKTWGSILKPSFIWGIWT